MTAPTGPADRGGSAGTTTDDQSDAAPAGEAARRSTEGGRRARWLTIGLPALIAYIPLLFTHVGMVGADTKTYLYLDPVKLLSGAPYVWDSQIGLGTVTHQNIGYLFPMGPFYLFFQALGFVPDWVAQRLWLGTVMFAAGMGARYLIRTLNETRLRPAGGGRAVAAATPVMFGPAATLVATLADMLSPYLLEYAARISVILMPWAALPWLIALAAKAIRHGGWRYPAWFAFVVLAVGGINATALLLVGLGPALWALHAVFVDREATFRQALAAVGRIAALTLVTSLWWIAGLWAEGRYGLPVIRYTETYQAVASVSTAPEVLRGLGYWFFYGTDKLGPWIEPSVSYTQWIWLLGISYLIPTLALLSAAFVRWRYRAYSLALVAVGTLVAVAGHPWESPSLLGGIFKAATRTDAGLSLRSTPRAVPLVVLGMALLLASGVEAIGRRVPRLAVPTGVLACLLIILNMPSLFTNQMVAENLQRPEDIPEYWEQNAEYLQDRGLDTRVLEIPGSDFASYRWGNTVDPVLPGLMTRGYAARELFAWGAPQSSNLLNALDRRLHEDMLEPEALVPMAQLMAAGDINVRSDMQYERYRLVRPRQLWDLVRRAPGLGAPVEFGGNTPPNRAEKFTMQDELELGSDPNLAEPPKVAAVPLDRPYSELRVVTAQQPMLLAGDGEGLVDAASLGLVNPQQPIFYSASLVNDPTNFDRIYQANADLLVTDSNRRRARRWGGLRENTGYTERPGEKRPEFDPSDQRLDLFPGVGDNAYTVTEQRSVDPDQPAAVVTATNYGNPITYTPDDRPANAYDNDPLTAWRVGALSDVADERLFLDFARPVTTDRIGLLQPINLERTRWLTRVRLTFTAPDGSESFVDADLDDRSRDERARDTPDLGQEITFPSRRIKKLTISMLDTASSVDPHIGLRPGPPGISGIGLAEVTIPGLQNEEVVRPPTDLLERIGETSIDHRLTWLFTRQRSNPAEPVRGDEEPSLYRLVYLPTARSFAVSGQARLSGLLDGDKWASGRINNAVDKLLGIPDHTEDGVTATADVHLPGSLEQRASASIDGDPTTFWSSIFLNGGDRREHYLEYTLSAPTSFDHLEMDIVNDRRHSIPTELTLYVDGAPTGTVIPLPTIAPQDQPNGTAHVRVPLPSGVTGTTFRFVISDFTEVTTDEWYSDGGRVVLPVGIAEIGIPNVRIDKSGANFDSGCRTDLLSIDGTAVPVRVTGTTADALARRPLAVAGCTPTNPDAPMHDSVGGISLSSGAHVVRTRPGRNPDIGIDLDRLAFTSDRGGDALARDHLPSTMVAAPQATDVDFERIDGHLRVDHAERPFWVVLGQSWNNGWTATVNGQSLGVPVPANGYANAWYVDPAVVGTGPLEVRITWSPQRFVWVFIGISVLGALLCILVIVLGRRRRREQEPLVEEPERPLVPEFVAPWSRAAESPRSARPSLVVSLIATVAFGLFAAANVPVINGYPLLGLVFAATLFVFLRARNGTGWSALGGAACLAAAGTYITVKQHRDQLVSNGLWALMYERVHILGLAVVMLVAAEAIRDMVHRHRPVPPVPPDAD